MDSCASGRLPNWRRGSPGGRSASGGTGTPSAPRTVPDPRLCSSRRLVVCAGRRRGAVGVGGGRDGPFLLAHVSLPAGWQLRLGAGWMLRDGWFRARRSVPGGFSRSRAAASKSPLASPSARPTGLTCEAVLGNSCTSTRLSRFITLPQSSSGFGRTSWGALRGLWPVLKWELCVTCGCEEPGGACPSQTGSGRGSGNP